MIAVLIIILLLILLFVFATICRKDHKDFRKLQGFYYAHRGLHGPGIPENSMLAFRKAKEAGYGIELDIHLLADGNLAVIHDSLLKRTTGLEGEIEDLRTEQLSECYLENTLQTIPQFQQVLDLYSGEAPLIVELKCYRNNYAQLCEAACKMLDAYDGVYCLESFDPRCIRWLRKNRPELIRGQLAENYFRSKSTPLPWYLKFVLSFQLMNFLVFPDFISYRFSDRKHISNFLCGKIWKANKVTWTLRNQKDFDKAIAEGWLPIFEAFNP